MGSTIEYRGLSIELRDGAFSFGKDGSLTLSVDAPTTITLRPLRMRLELVSEHRSVPAPAPPSTALARALARLLSVLAAAGATAVIPVVMERLSARSPWQSRPPLTLNANSAGGRPRRKENVGGRHPWRGG